MTRVPGRLLLAAGALLAALAAGRAAAGDSPRARASKALDAAARDGFPIPRGGLEAPVPAVPSVTLKAPEAPGDPDSSPVKEYRSNGGWESREKAEAAGGRNAASLEKAGYVRLEVSAYKEYDAWKFVIRYLAPREDDSCWQPSARPLEYRSAGAWDSPERAEEAGRLSAQALEKAGYAALEVAAYKEYDAWRFVVGYVPCRVPR